MYCTHDSEHFPLIRHNSEIVRDEWMYFSIMIVFTLLKQFILMIPRHEPLKAGNGYRTTELT